MAIIRIAGFKVYANLDGTKSIIIDSDNIDACMRIYAENHLEGVAITTSHDYKLDNVDFLSRYPDIKHLSISDGITDISAIHLLGKLKSLVVSGKNRKIDFFYFPLLEKLSIDWSVHFSNMDNCKHLSTLSLYNYNPKTKDCLGISNLHWIKNLEITQSPIHSLNGLDKFNQLKELKINYCSKLEVLCCLEKSKETLIAFLCDHCKSINNHEYVTAFRHLSILAFNDGGTIPSLKFIKKISSLKNFRFVGTDVADGDMTPCIGLDYVGFSDKRHFSHTMKQINNLSKT
ncbi:hypothetical protein HQ865_11520 [Mucilaginibacter mali]|uniref:Leucine rich repeat (LRR) protein n=1 Tax=Mucilaginibacter mali TaxID=2740462 RepID=A0A7D4UPE5_9SPHI|nr:hypothetical protein [Mucilaginibacter mali]QKJ30360.1 hypothetical protein HQ865_11520 [Mucilaginibacter mali]